MLPRIRERLPGVKTYIIGSDAPPIIAALAADDFVITGFVPDVTPYFTDCRVSVSPLRYGAGVKGKVNLAMSYGLPVVATTPSIEGMRLTPGDDVLVADEPEAFADAVARAYTDQALWTRLAEGGRENIRMYFSREVARAALVEVLTLRARRRKDEVPYAVTARDAASFELGERAVIGTRCECFGGVRKQRLSAKRRQDGSSVVLPVRCHVQVAAGFKPQRERVHEFVLEQAALVMTLFRPRIGEEHVNAGKRARSDHRVHHLDRVVADDPDIVEIEGVDALQQRPYAGRVHVDGEEIVIAKRCSDRRGGLTHAEADFEDGRALSSEDPREIERFTAEPDAETGQQRVVRFALRR